MKNVFFLISLNLFFSVVALAEIPSSLMKLASIRDKNSDAYLFLSQEAAIDTKNSAERMLDGQNSAGALKILEVAVHLMPHRTDINALRLQALQTYVDITKKLEENSVKNCSLLQERYQFLKNIAPDALASLKLERSCSPVQESNSVKTEEALLKLPEPPTIKGLEVKFKPELVKIFPWDDVLANSFMLFRSLLGEEFKISCDGFDSGKVVCSKTKLGDDFKDTTTQYCGYVEGLLSVSHGRKSILCTYDKKNIFKTTPELYQIYAKVFDNGAFDDDIPTFAVAVFTLKYMNKSAQKELLVQLNPKDFRNGKPLEFKSKDLLINEVNSFLLTKDELIGLKDLTIHIDFKKSYELYHRHFKDSLKNSLVEEIQTEFK